LLSTNVYSAALVMITTWGELLLSQYQRLTDRQTDKQTHHLWLSCSSKTQHEKMGYSLVYGNI